MTCKDCCFFWEDDDEKYPRCHFEERTCWDIPPCEYEDEYNDSTEYAEYADED